MKRIIWSAFTAMGLLMISATAADGQWLTDFTQAQEKAKQENKVMLLDFTGSDWCPPCKMLEKEVFSKKEFQEFAGKNLVLVEVDFPQKKKLPAAQAKANDKLLKQYKVEAFPTILLLDSTGKKLGSFEGYGGEDVKEYISKIEKVMAKKKS